MSRGIWLINHSLGQRGVRTVEVDLVDILGRTVSSQTIVDETEPNTSRRTGKVEGLDVEDVMILRLQLFKNNKVSSRNVYWLTEDIDALDWKNSTWYYTPVTKYVNYTSLSKMEAAAVKVTVGASMCRSRTEVSRARA